MLLLDQLIIPWLIFVFILITCLHDVVMILLGEVLSWSLIGVKGLNKKMHFILFITISSCSNVGPMSVSEKLHTYPSPNTTLTLTC